MNGGFPTPEDGSGRVGKFSWRAPDSDPQCKGRERNRDGQTTKARLALMDVNFGGAKFPSTWESALLALKKVCAGSKSFFKTREV